MQVTPRKFQGFALDFNATTPKYINSFTPTDIYSEAKSIPGDASVPTYNWGPKPSEKKVGELSANPYLTNSTSNQFGEGNPATQTVSKIHLDPTVVRHQVLVAIADTFLGATGVFGGGSSSSIGNTTYHSDGSSSSRFGNTRITQTESHRHVSVIPITIRMVRAVVVGLATPGITQTESHRHVSVIPITIRMVRVAVGLAIRGITQTESHPPVGKPKGEQGSSFQITTIRDLAASMWLISSRVTPP